MKERASRGGGVPGARGADRRASRWSSAALQLPLGGGVLAAAGVALLGTPAVAPTVVLQALLVYAAIAALVAWTLGPRGLRADFGVANSVTLLRAVLVAALSGWILHPELAAAAGWWPAAIALLVLVLDGADGWLARHNGSASEFGARFDMELDAFLILVLALLALELGQAGSWVLLLGLMRYAFVLLGRWYPPLRAPLPPSRRRKTVCVLQISALLVAIAPPVPPALASALLALALAALSASFWTDLQWLLRRAAHHET